MAPGKRPKGARSETESSEVERTRLSSSVGFPVR